MPFTTDSNDPRLTRGVDSEPSAQAAAYLVLSDAERARGFVRPVRDRYTHRGLTPPANLRDLTPEEHQRYNVDRADGYVKFEEYGPERSPVVGNFWTQARLDAIRGCGTETTMARPLAETFARDPKFYGGTYCVGCQKHLPVGEFVWADGSVVGS
jgi:hypothetical protein